MGKQKSAISMRLSNYLVLRPIGIEPTTHRLGRGSSIH